MWITRIDHNCVTTLLPSVWAGCRETARKAVRVRVADGLVYVMQAGSRSSPDLRARVARRSLGGLGAHAAGLAAPGLWVCIAPAGGRR
jgi:hypothetical protein